MSEPDIKTAHEGVEPVQKLANREPEKDQSSEGVENEGADEGQNIMPDTELDDTDPNVPEQTKEELKPPEGAD